MLVPLFGISFLLALITPAMANTNGELDGASIAILVVLGCGLIVAVAAFITFASWVADGIASLFYVPPSPPPRPEDYDQMATINRAKARAVDAQAEYDDSCARAALKRAELQEIEDFLKGQKTKRVGSNAGRR